MVDTWKPVEVAAVPLATDSSQVGQILESRCLEAYEGIIAISQITFFRAGANSTIGKFKEIRVEDGIGGRRRGVSHLHRRYQNKMKARQMVDLIEWRGT